MERSHVRYMLVGGGIASSGCAEAIRELDKSEPIMLVAQEISRPYDRAPLSKSYLRRETAKRELVAKQVDWYAANNIDLRTGRRVTQIDAGRSAVFLDNGDEVFYDTLLLAIGTLPKPIGLDGGLLPNTFYLKTIADADRLHHAIEISRSVGHNRACVVGAGLLGVEVAASLAMVGMQIDLIQAHATPWPKIAGELTGGFLSRRIRSTGARIHQGVRAIRLEGDGRVQRVVLSDGTTIPADFVVAAVGSVINRQLLSNTQIAAESAIMVDQRGQTNVPNIYAAGDCSAIFDPIFGKHRASTHWDHARQTGRICGINMAGGEARYDSVTHFTTELADLVVHVWGDGRFVHHRLMRGNALNDDGNFAEVGVSADGRIAQVIAIGRGHEHFRYRDLVRNRFDTTGLEEQCKDPARPIPE
ncbi:MAG: FAD-dependent oxidoreductase [Burkholderiales bacterium]|nr:FAD-dependent oxidoreductase [Phycisphaerae bacterium]